MSETRKRTVYKAVRLTPEEDATLRECVAASGLSVGDFIRSRALAQPPAGRRERVATVSIEDRDAFAEALRLLSDRRIPSNINQLAKAANVGEQPTAEALAEALAHVREIRDLFLTALRRKPE